MSLDNIVIETVDLDKQGANVKFHKGEICVCVFIRIYF